MVTSSSQRALRGTQDIAGGTGVAAIVTRSSSGTNTTYYPLKDHLGSTDRITNSSGTVVVALSYDAFGRRRGSNWTGSPSSGDWTNIAATTRHGFSGHEQLDNLTLVHMNGRVQDPVIGRFISADPFVQSLCQPQSLNRMSYVWNNPLTHTDSTGFILDSSVQTICVNGCGGDTLMGEMTVARDAWGDQALADMAFLDLQISLSNISGPGAREIPESELPEGVQDEVTTTASRPSNPDFSPPIILTMPPSIPTLPPFIPDRDNKPSPQPEECKTSPAKCDPNLPRCMETCMTHKPALCAAAGVLGGVLNCGPLNASPCGAISAAAIGAACMQIGTMQCRQYCGR